MKWCSWSTINHFLNGFVLVLCKWFFNNSRLVIIILNYSSKFIFKLVCTHYQHTIINLKLMTFLITFTKCLQICKGFSTGSLMSWFFFCQNKFLFLLLIIYQRVKQAKNSSVSFVSWSLNNYLLDKIKNSIFLCYEFGNVSYKGQVYNIKIYICNGDISSLFI